MKVAVIVGILGKLESILGWDDIEYLIFASSWIYHKVIDESGGGRDFHRVVAMGKQSFLSCGRKRSNCVWGLTLG